MSSSPDSGGSHEAGDVVSQLVSYMERTTDLVGVADARNAIRNLARVNRQTMARCLPAIFALILDGKGVDDAVAMARAD